MNINSRGWLEPDEPPKTERIPWLEGRPAREKVITKDDIVNLVIELNTTRDVLELNERT